MAQVVVLPPEKYFFPSFYFNIPDDPLFGFSPFPIVLCVKTLMDKHTLVVVDMCVCVYIKNSVGRKPEAITHDRRNSMPPL